MKNDAHAIMQQQAELAEAAVYAQEWINTATTILEAQPEILRSAEPNPAFEALAASVEGLDWLHQLAIAAHNLGDIRISENGESEFSRFGNDLLRITTELVKVMESCDNVMLADLVEYELLPLLASFRESADLLTA